MKQPIDKLVKPETRFRLHASSPTLMRQLGEKGKKRRLFVKHATQTLKIDIPAERNFYCRIGSKVLANMTA